MCYIYGYVIKVCWISVYIFFLGKYGGNVIVFLNYYERRNFMWLKMKNLVYKR